MYNTCLFCDRSLGTNEAVEHFPVGRRLAFDAAKGRLWAVCRECQRWNLSPLDERWEAIEECERLFEGTRLRASTDQIGLARVADGTELIRIGSPPRGEFAAWRYGDQFGKRRQRMFLRAGAIVVVGGTIAVTHGFGLFAAGAIPGGSFLWQVPGYLDAARKANRVVARGTTIDGMPFVMRGKHLGKAVLRGRADDLRLEFKHETGRGEVGGAEATRVAALALAHLNADGAGRADVARAVTAIERSGGPEALLAASAAVVERPRKTPWYEYSTSPQTKGGFKAATRVTRLALEMAVNEENERRLLHGELGALAESWKAAEEIAQISDDMFVGPAVIEKLSAIKAGESRRIDP